MRARLPPDAKARERFLLNRFSTPVDGPLDAPLDWPFLTPLERHEALYVLDVLETYVRPHWPSMQPVQRTNQTESACPKALDVGAKDGRHLPALTTYFPADWCLVELQGRARYWNLATREAYGHAMARRYPPATYISADVMDIPGTFDFITWTLPFVRPGPLVAWGLPEEAYKPQTLLANVLARLRPGGCLWVVNQGTAERDVQMELFEHVLDGNFDPHGDGAPKGKLIQVGRVRSPLCPFKKARFGFLWRRSAHGANSS